ncbi:MAG: hypothetical protein U1D31_00420 [Patescibacteria group bacterium]|nr:hypothetical protein [bacterium]MDZ4240585.1 hypothetical protein [Patescibacteria group bacterium]
MPISDVRLKVIHHIHSVTKEGNISWILGIKELSYYGMWNKRELRLGWTISPHIPCLRLTCAKGQCSINGFEPTVRTALASLKEEVLKCSERRISGREDMIKIVQQREKARTKRKEKEERNPILLEFLSEEDIIRVAQ